MAVIAAFLSSPLRALGAAGGGGGVSEIFLFAGAAAMGGSGVGFVPPVFATSAGAPEITKITIKSGLRIHINFIRIRVRRFRPIAALASLLFARS